MAEVATLQRADELPLDYRSGLDAQNLLPAWTLLRALMPVGAAAPVAQPAQWSYAKLRPYLMRAADLVPMEKAERRVLGYVNPGLDRARLSTLPSIFFGLQLIMPGERAPNHKHIPAAARIIIEGEGAYTTVDGEKLHMDEGDVVLTERTVPGGSLYIWGFRPEIYYLTGLNPATRFIFQFPLVADWYPQAWRQENVDTLWAALPPYVAVLQVDYMPWVTGSQDDSNTLLQSYEELNDWLIYNYEPETQIGNFFLWRRKAA
jgi:hypothetical protein